MASAFLAVVAIMVYSPALFYMGTALIATIVAAKLQARYSVRKLRLVRAAPAMVRQGEIVPVTFEIESESKLSRPLLLLEDQLPPSLKHEWIQHALPVAPSYKAPVLVQYQFRPLRRGLYRWNQVQVFGTDALGLASTELQYDAGETSLRVLPTPVPFDLDLNLVSGQGYEESAPKRLLSSSLDTRGVREYVPGDSVRHIHWASSARVGRVMVKDFDSYASSRATILLQRQRDLGLTQSQMDTMVGHAAFLVEKLLPIASVIQLNDPVQEGTATDRSLPYLSWLADVQPTSPDTLAQEVRRVSHTDHGRVFLLVAAPDPELVGAIRSLPEGSVHVLLHADPRRPQLSALAQEFERAGATVQILGGAA